jgi:hypothetical protein
VRSVMPMTDRMTPPPLIRGAYQIGWGGGGRVPVRGEATGARKEGDDGGRAVGCAGGVEGRVRI